MTIISRSALRFCRHLSASRIASSGAPRWYPPWLARRAPLPLTPAASASALPEKLLGRLPRFVYEYDEPSVVFYHGIGLGPEKSQVEMDRATQGMDKPETRDEINDVLDMESTPTDGNGLWHASILDESTHRDGAIYKNMERWRQILMDIDDRNERFPH
ncbi:unnamed protein product [Urochloa humidicola]